MAELDYKTLYLLLTDSSSFDELDLGSSLATVQRHVTIALSGELTDQEHFDELVDHFLPKFIPVLLKAVERYRDNHQVLNLVKKLMETTVVLASRAIHRGLMIHMDLLCTMVQQHRVYQIDARDFLESNLILDSIDAEYVAIPERRSSVYLPTDQMIIIEHFGKSGGFGALLSHYTEGVKPSIPWMKRSIDLCYNCREYLSKRGRKLVVDICRSLFAAFMTFTDDELKPLRKQDVEEVITLMEFLLPMCMDPDAAAKETEHFCLEFSLKCFRTKLLEKRLNGLVYLDDAVEMVENKDNFDGPYMIGFPKVTKWMTSRYLVDWLRKHQIVKALFDPASTHHEILTHASRIVGFLASNNALSKEEMDGIWNLTFDPYLSLAALDSLAAVCVDLKKDHANYFWNKIQALQKSQVLARHIAISERFSRNLVPPEDILGFYADVFSDDSKATEKTVQLAIDKYCEIAMSSSMKPKRLVILDGLLTLIANGKSVGQNITIVTKMLEDMPADISSHESNARAQAVVSLQHRSKILDVLLEDFVTYREAASIAAASLVSQTEDGVVSLNMDTAVLHGIYPHLQQLEKRLGCLRVVVASFPPDFRDGFQADDADLLWEELTNRHISATERRLCFSWFSSLINVEKGIVGLADDVIAHIFEKWLCQLRFGSLEPGEFRCIKLFFLQLNVIDRAIYVGKSEEDIEVLNTEEIRAVDVLWRVLVECEHAAVFDATTALLVVLHTKLSKSQQHLRSKVTNSFISHCMGNLHRGVQPSSPNVLQINHCISLLKRFLVACVEEARRQQEAAVAAPAPRPNTFQPNAAHLKQLVEFMAVSDAVATVALEKSRNNLEQALEALMDPDNAARYLTEAHKFEAKPSAVLSRDEFISPTALLTSTPEYFDMLFSTLDVEGVDRNAVWDIINQLPRSGSLETSLKELNQPQWETILESSSTHRLLYGLQTIEHLMTPADTSEANEQSHKSWRKKFFYTGGFTYLYRLLKDMNVDPDRLQSDPAFKRCLLHLLGIIHMFVRDHLKDISEDLSEPTGLRKKLALSTSTAQQLLASIDFDEFLGTLLDLVANVVYTSKHDAHDLTLLEHSMFLIVRSAISRPSLIQRLYDFASKGDLYKERISLNQLLHDVLIPRVGLPWEVTRVVSTGIQLLCASTSWDSLFTGAPNKAPAHPLKFFFACLLTDIPKGSPTAEFFTLSVALLDRLLSGPLRDATVTEKANEWLSWFDGWSGEESESKPDAIAVGLLRLLGCVFKHDEKTKAQMSDKLQQLLIDGTSIAEVADVSTAKFKSTAARTASFDLLAQLARGNVELFEKLITILTPFQKIAITDDSRTSEKSYTGYVGIKNLGSTCYMNSIVQQFYMLPKLRSGVLAATQSFLAAPSIEPSKAELDNGRVLCEMGKLFAFLKRSQRSYYDPKDFASANDIDIRLQQDADEFFNVFCDKLEQALSSTPQKGLLDEVFGGTLMQAVRCSTNKEHVSKSEDRFLTLSVDIENKSELDQALASYFDGDNISSYHCEKCNQKVNAVKQFRLKRLSNTLIIHLKRFKFNVLSMQKEKLQNRIQFPLTLNVKKFLDEIPAKMTEDDYTYDLKGILVHTGTADAGHYYSFIKERDHAARWMRFDDTRVDEFDEAEIPIEAFGGVDSGNYREDHLEHGFRHRNGYMLFYDKRTNSSPPSSTYANNQLGVFSKDIEEDNKVVSRQRLVCTTSYSDLFFNVCSLAPDFDTQLSPGMSVTCGRLITSYFLDRAVRSRDKSVFTKWAQLTASIVDKSVLVAKWFLYQLCHSKKSVLKFGLLESTDEYILESFSQLVQSSICALAKVEHEKVSFTVEPENTTPEDLRGVMVHYQFVDYLIDIMETTRAHWRRFHYYWVTLFKISQLGHRQRELLHRREMVALTIDYYMGKFSPECKDDNRTPISDPISGVYPRLDECMGVLDSCIRSYHTPATLANPRIRPPTMMDATEGLLMPSPREIDFIWNRDYMLSFIRQGYNNAAASGISAHLAFESPRATIWLLEIISESLRKSTVSQLANNFVTLNSLFAIDDTFRQWRAAVWFAPTGAGFFTTLKAVHASAQEKTDELLEHFVAMIKKYPVVAGWLHHCRAEWFGDVMGVLAECVRFHRRKESPQELFQILDGHETFLRHFETGESGVSLLWPPFNMEEYEFQQVQAVTMPGL